MTQDAPQVFTEKTIPTSMVVSMIGWALRNGRMLPGVRVCTVKLLNGLVELCLQTGKFNLQIQPEMAEGPMFPGPSRKKTSISECWIQRHANYPPGRYEWL